MKKHFFKTIFLFFCLSLGVSKTFGQNYLFQWGGTGTAAGQFTNSHRITIDGSGNVYVTDNNRVQKFSNTGAPLLQLSGAGSGNGQFNGTTGVAVDHLGNIFVADRFNYRIQKFSSTGAYITQWGSNGTGNGQFRGLRGITVDAAGNVYAVDGTPGNRIQKFSNSGTYISQFGSTGSGNGQLTDPTDIKFDASGNIYVADNGNNRIQKFNSSGIYESQFGSSGSGNKQFYMPWSISIDGSGNLFVVDAGNHRVQKFKNDGTYITQWNTSGITGGEFGYVTGLAIDQTGRIYVADFDKNRVQVFDWPVFTNGIGNVTLFPNSVNVAGPTVGSNPLPGGFSTSIYIVGNGAYQPGTNTPYFTVQNKTVYNSSGTSIGDLPIYNSGSVYYSQLAKEMAIVPVPGSCGRFYVIYIGCSISGTMVMKAIVNATNPASVYIESSDSRLYPSGGAIPAQSGNIAVTKRKTNGNYDLYVLWYDHFKKFEITSTGINHTSSFTPLSMPQPFTTELELSHDETYLSFSSYSSIYRVKTDGSDLRSVSLPNNTIYGIEFHPSNKDIVFVSDYTSIIKKISFATNPGTVTNITMPTGWAAAGQLEKDAQGRIYGVFTSSGNPGRLFNFDANGTTFTNTNIPVYSNDNGVPPSGYSLNDQIDGEDYSTFRGVAEINLSSTINSTANTNPNWNSFYNCTPINLLLTTSGNQSRVILTKVDASKTPIGGTGAYSYTSTWQAPSNFNVDLRTLAGTSSYLLNNNGYFSLVIESQNSCGETSSVTWYLQINATPTAASISLKLNDSNPATAPGLPVTPSYTSPGIAMNTYAGSYNLDNSTGDITYRSIKIEQVNSAGGFIRDIVNPAYQEAVTGSVSSLTALQLNSVSVPAIPALSWGGGSGFFVSNGLNNYYKITVTVGNACGSSSDYSYIKLDNSWAKMSYSNSEDNFSNSAYPNPFDNELTLSVTKGENAKVMIYNSLGRVVFEKQFESTETGAGMIVIKTSELSKGAYIYKVESLGTTTTGTVVK